jgi:hypothetical protein
MRKHKNTVIALSARSGGGGGGGERSWQGERGREHRKREIENI